MAQPGSDVFGQAAVWLGGGGVITLLGVFLRGVLTGAAGQEKELRTDLAARLALVEERLDLVEKRLTIMTRERDAWRHLALQARLEAERLGYDRTKWPDDPKGE
ncbi:hypothetical protein L1280_002774 [Deinococcus sp. HSC-46F16]|uniref:hypothetical protein n=1 Tax=Deinococcus sp. HSC-46F16 TaxID=2910968 RepID=UPI0020A222AA|nr:hypothetical protein [Deinococcus sp. HSC-46F16]MCP2015606.1 hypothetical protein [Deinococcus sp. HSC-46F16]